MTPLNWLLCRSSTSRFRLMAEEVGATATEYSLLTAFVALIIVAGVGLFGTSLSGLYIGLTGGVKTALGLP